MGDDMIKTTQSRWVRQSSRIALIVAAGMAATMARAQDAAPQDDNAQAAEEIVVTGSNIKGASDSGAIAVTTLGKEEIESFGASSTGEIM